MDLIVQYLLVITIFGFMGTSETANLQISNMNCTPSEITLTYDMYWWNFPEGYYYSDTCIFTFHFDNGSFLRCDYEADLRSSTITIETSLGTKLTSHAYYDEVYSFNPTAKLTISLVPGSITYIKRISCTRNNLGFYSIHGNPNMTVEDEPYTFPLLGNGYSQHVFERKDKKKMRIYLIAPSYDIIHLQLLTGSFFYINGTDPDDRPASTLDFLKRGPFETEKFVYITTKGGMDTEAELLFVDPKKSYDLKFITDWKERDKELLLNATEKPIAICVATYTDYRFNRGMFISGVNITTPNTTLFVVARIPYRDNIGPDNILAAYNETEIFETPHLFGGAKWTFVLEKGEVWVNISNQLRLPIDRLNTTTGIYGRMVNNRHSQDDGRPTMIEIPSNFTLSLLCFPDTGLQMNVKIKKPYEEPNAGSNIWWEGSEGYLSEQETNFIIKSRPVYFGPINDTLTLDTKSINVTLWPNESVEYHIVLAGDGSPSAHYLLLFVISAILPLFT